MVSQESKTISKPFTYLIGWSKYRLFYYGVRYAKDCQTSDLWSKYFTSSVPVKEARTELGEPDIIQIRKTFPSAEAARKWEMRVLKRIKAVTRDDFLNLTDSETPTMLGKKQSEEMKAHLSKLFKGQPGRVWTEEQRIKNSNSHKGKIFTEEHRANISKRRTNMVFSDEHRANIGKAQLGRKQGIDSQKKRSESLKKYHAERKLKKLIEEINE